MKNLTIILFLIFFQNSFCQNFTIKKVLSTNAMGNNLMKMKGKIIVNDSIISFHFGEQITNMAVEKTDDMNNYKMFRIKKQNSINDIETRITLSPSVKENEYLLRMELKDNFTQKIDTYTYFMIKD